jgi:hypothetical protein
MIRFRIPTDRVRAMRNQVPFTYQIYFPALLQVLKIQYRRHNGRKSIQSYGCIFIARILLPLLLQSLPAQNLISWLSLEVLEPIGNPPKELFPAGLSVQDSCQRLSP